jgi:RNA polymerase sigma-70 factor (ECF subfamily)
MDEALRESAQPLIRAAGSQLVEEWVRTQFEELAPGLRRYLLRLTGNPALADDLAQESFLRLFEERRKRRTVKNPRCWLFQVGHNLAVDHLRRCGQEEWCYQEEQLLREERHAPSAESQMLQAERRRQVRNALSLLSANERQVLELRAEGLRYREIAEMMGLQISTVATFLSRAVNKIVRQIHG